MTKDEHLAHLLTLTPPRFCENYAMTRARELALTAGREDLPALLAAAMQKLPPSKPSGRE